MWLFKRERDLRMQCTEQKGGSCYEHASDRPINSCRSGNRPVNIERPGRGGGNERGKGSLVPSHSTSPFTTSYPLGREEVGKGQVPTAVAYI